MRIAINGFGRIGRAVFRIAEADDDIEIVAVNDLFDNEALRYLLMYDTVMGRFEGDVEVENNQMVTSRSRVTMFAERDPANLPWGDLGIDAVVESTGVFRSRNEVGKHIKAGAARALLTVPAKDEIDYTVVLGVNEDGLSANHQIISNASCTTNCLAPVAKVLNDEFGVREGVINTVHAYTNDQSLWMFLIPIGEGVVLLQRTSSQLRLAPPRRLVKYFELKVSSMASHPAYQSLTGQ